MTARGTRIQWPGDVAGAVVLLALGLLLSAPLATLAPRLAAAHEAAVGAWTRLAVDADWPGPRWDHTLAADEAGERLILFGGRDGEGAPLGDTWRFDLASERWEQIEGSGPAPRFGHAVAVDQEARELYLFGGQADGATFFDDAWRFDLETGAWSEIGTGDGPRPSVRYGTSAVFDGEGRLLVSHGFTFEGRFDDTWALDLETGAWTDVSPPEGEVRPLKRCLHEAVWDAANGRMLLFGGCSSGVGPCPQGDLWAFDPAARVWTELSPAAGPAARSNPALVIDPANARALLLHGLTENGNAADAWALALDHAEATWTEVAPTADGDVPAARFSHDAAILGDRLYLFGGNGDGGALADLWALDL